MPIEPLLHVFAWAGETLARAGEAASTARGGVELMLSGPWAYVVAALLGAVTGSFLNVVIVRLPEGISIVRPASHCMGCKTPVAFYDNIPLFSYLILRGKCRHCGVRFSALYFFVELASTALAVAVFHHTANPGDPWIGAAHFVAEFVFVSVMVVVAFIDLRTWIIPNVITYPAVLVFLGTSILLRRLVWWEGLAGAAAGFSVLAVTIWGYLRLTGREGMGWGDAKLLAAVGAFLGWRHLPAVVFLGAVQGLIAALVCLALGRSMEPTHTFVGLEDDENEQGEEGDTEEEDAGNEEEKVRSMRHVPVPFGPFLALAAVEVLFFGEVIMKLWIPN